ncbi:MAG TPA: hypothetical protein VFY82_06835 [Acidimicrobiales bacterium]|nr:hypothetical protein [Acidimicrobiales bacterium]
MTDSPWNPPTGPPNGVPLRPADARREIDDAIAAATTADRELRAELSAATTEHVQAADRLEIVADEVDEAESLAKRALVRANDDARAGQRADAAKWTAAAQVFAMRMRDGREAHAELEHQVATATERAERARSALAANIGRLEAVASARLPVLSGRKASKAQRDVDDTVAALAVPTDDLVADAVRSARAAEEAAEVAGPVVVADDDLESEVDVESTDDILAALRTELDLPAAPEAGSGAPASPDPDANAAESARDGSGAAESAGDDSGAAEPAGADDGPSGTTSGAGATAGDERAGAGDGPSAPASSGRRGPSGGGRSWPVPARR